MADIPNLVPTQIPILHQRAQPIHLEGLLPAQNQAVHKNFYTGDTLQLPKPTSSMRVYFQNVNGINLTSTGNWDVICEHLQDMEVDIALLAKHKLDTNQPWVNQKLRDMARAVFGLGSFSIMAATTPVESPTMYKPGGVLSLINGNVKGRMLSADKDPLGRWVYTSLRQNTGPLLTIVTTYQVIDVNPCQAGPTTYATQLYATYLQEGRQHPENLRSHHAHDLLKFVKQCQARGKWIIVTGDLNEVLGTTDHGLTKLHSECKLLNACLERHGPTEFTAYQWGTKVINYILVD